MLDTLANQMDGNAKSLQSVNSQSLPVAVRRRAVHNQEVNTATIVESSSQSTTLSHEVDEGDTPGSKSNSILTQHSRSLETNNMSGIDIGLKEKLHSNQSTNSKSSISDFLTSDEHHSSKVNSKMLCNEMTLNPNSDNVQPVVQRNRLKNFGWSRLRISDIIDVGVRVAMVLLFVHLESRPSFRRKIAVEQMWQYKYPRSPDIVTAHALLISVVFCPFLTTIAMYLLTGNRRDFRAASWVWTLALCLNGITTSLLKVTVGRPRPDFFARCFPDAANMSIVLNNPSLYGTASVGVYNFNCTGNVRDVNEGYKSFPSGHSSFAFTSFGFISIYVGSKLHAFTKRGRGETWRLIITVLPLVVAALIAVSRTCDYHHHYEDVTVGAVIGIFSTLIAYRQYYPSIGSLNAHVCLARGDGNGINLFSITHNGYKHLSSTDDDDEVMDGAGHLRDTEYDVNNGNAVQNDKPHSLTADGDKPNKWI